MLEINKQYLGEFNYFKAMHSKDESTYIEWVKWRNTQALQLMNKLDLSTN